MPVFDYRKFQVFYEDIAWYKILLPTAPSWEQVIIMCMNSETGSLYVMLPFAI